MKGIKTGLPWKPSAHTLNSNGLGALGAAPNKTGRASIGTDDPIEQYGNKAASIILSSLAELPQKDRAKALKEIMDEVDPKIYPMFKKEVKQAEGAGSTKQVAMQRGIAVAFKKGFVGEVMRIGRKKKAPTPGTRKGAVPLGAATGFEAQASNYYQGLGGVLSTIKDAVNKLGGLACDVATNPITPIAAGAATAAAGGGPAGASTAVTGVGIAAAACSSGQSAGTTFAPVRRGMPSWAIPAIIGGGVLTLVLVLK